MTAASAWPPALAGTPAITVIERALDRQRLAHSLLLHGDDHDTLVVIAHAIADRLLNVKDVAAKFAPAQHPDCFELRPSGKMRMIRVGEKNSPEPGTMREFIRRLSVSSAIAPQKVGIMHEADRMNTETANTFLKTLEEPPAHTTLLLLTTRPYSLLPTIRSRVLHFRFPAAAEPLALEGWKSWLDDYGAWLGRLSEGVADKRAASDAILAVYGFVARFGKILDDATAAALAAQKEKLPPDLDEDEQVAIETGLANGLRSRLFAEIESATRAFALPRLTQGDAATRNALTAAVGTLEHATGLLRLNLNESAVLEEFLLASLRLWTKRT